MKSNELRIGNYLNDPYGDYTNVDVNVLDYLVKCERDSQRNEKYKPIPLTEEELKKFGFKKQIDEIDNHVQFHYVVNDNLIALFKNDDMEGVLINNHMHETKLIKSMHQLQNLYHALTGEELTIN